MLANRRRKPQHIEIDSEGTWIISYADMITLLLAFFVMFFTVNPKGQKADQLQAALVQALGKSASASERYPAALPGGFFEEPTVSTAVLEKLGVVVHEVNGRVLVEFPSVSFFESGEIEVTLPGVRTLSQFTKKYLPFAGSYTLGVQAFTDQQKVIKKPGRRFEDNLELSALRAIAAMRILSKAGVPLRRMKISGFGEMATTVRELAQSREDNKMLDPLALSRKVVLSIEPEVKQ